MQEITLKEFIISTLETIVKKDSKIIFKLEKEYGRKK